MAGGNAFQVMIDSQPYDPQPAYDGYGGYWIEVPYEPGENMEVAVRFSIHSGEQEPRWPKRRPGWRRTAARPWRRPAGSTSSSSTF